jgi:uncharacterized membrane protein YcjF (UPF0283 family)
VTAAVIVLTVALAGSLAINRLQWRRIGRLGQRIHQQHDAAMEQALAHEQARAGQEKTLTELRAENVTLLSFTVHGSPS